MKKHLHLMLSAVVLMACLTWGSVAYANAGSGDRPTSTKDNPVVIVDHVDGKDIGNLSIYPNPASTNTNVSFTLTTNGVVVIKFFDLLGKEVVTLNEKPLTVGNYKINLNVSDFSPGIYFCSITAGNTSITERLIVRRD